MIDSNIQHANDIFFDLITAGQIFAKIAFIVLCILSLVDLLIAVNKGRKKIWTCQFFIALCIMVLFYAVSSLHCEFFPASSSADALFMLRNIGLLFIPGFMFLHMWLYASYKPLRTRTIVGTLILPVIGAVYLICASLNMPMTQTEIAEGVVRIVLLIYAVVMVVRSYTLGLNVFYQMPRQMRKSMRRMLMSVSALLVYIVILIIWRWALPTEVTADPVALAVYNVCAPIAVCVLVMNLYSAQYYAPATNIVVTSRDFVFGNLSSLILVISNKMNIMDWNKKGKGSALPLPDPLFKEPLAHYHDRIIGECGGHVSPIDENVISIMHEDKEYHYQTSMYEAHNGKKQLGFVLEFNELTRSYAVMRSLVDTAETDQLTGLTNRNGYMNTVPRMATPENMPLLILVGDIDNLKAVNDDNGHLAGDRLLRVVADNIRRCLLSGSFAARIGGDEYVILIPHAKISVAKEFVAAVEAECSQIYDPDFGTPSISWGYSILDSAKGGYNEDEYNKALKEADTMMYESKKQRREFRLMGLMSGQKQR